ncbi:class I SAM-dependent methyltransferase [Streptomyces sp. NBC_01298]|uniref:class I SAM-dependent methyltransferase n=1 Tax=Streptomyces sp. NBC_01298 TaxID=2903817 RepID=UPI002E0DE402|nr:class I SAM-dependent methyltransferase [Streptomyces sp. NBC_01298]
MPDRALSFGARAEAYERFRPGYPPELFDLVREYAGGPVTSALEIGAGTGKATRLFAGQGVTVTATDPDGAMLRELRKHVRASGVSTVRASLEDLRPGRRRYGLVYAVAALHWTVPEGRWARVAALLEPAGVFASAGGQVRPADPAVTEAVRAARAPFLESDEVPSPDGTPPGDAMQWPGTELRRAGSAWFGGVRQVVIDRRLTMSADEYTGYLSTVSAYAALPALEREQVFRGIARVLPERVEIVADLVVHLARRR